MQWVDANVHREEVVLVAEVEGDPRVLVPVGLTQRVRALVDAVLLKARVDDARVVLGVDDLLRRVLQRTAKGRRRQRARLGLVRVDNVLVVGHVRAHAARKEDAHRPDGVAVVHGRQRRRRRRGRAAERRELVEDGRVQRAARGVEAGARRALDVLEPGDARFVQTKRITCARTRTFLSDCR